jgi:cysteine-rich repeat protein
MCGNGVIEQGEECDDGNRLDGDGCGPLCGVETGWACSEEPSVCESLCSNGVIDSGEQCDGEDLGGNDCETIPGGYTGGTLHCSASCLFDTTGCILPSCGDGNIDANEECDDGNTSNQDECLNNCQQAVCGDGYVNVGVEECDDGNTSNQDACKTDCTDATCGDGYVNVGVEECDDGNTSNGDGCVDGCVFATCGDGHLWAGSEECDDGNTLDGDGCSAVCTEETLPVLYSIASVSGGWSQTTLEYAGDPHAPSGAIVAAANVETRSEAYVFTTDSYHLLAVDTLQWTDHGPLTSRFPGVTGANINTAYGVSWSTGSESSITMIEGEWAHTFYVDNLTGAVTTDASNPQLIDWSNAGDHPPEPQDLSAMWIALENDEGWATGSPQQICGASSTSIGPYGGSISQAGSIHLVEAGYCFEFYDVMPLGSFPPFGVSGAPAAAGIVSAFYVSPKLYVIVTP